MTTSAHDVNVSTSEASKRALTQFLNASVELCGTTPPIFEILVTPA
jgi:hypothetical protein